MIRRPGTYLLYCAVLLGAPLMQASGAEESARPSPPQYERQFDGVTRELDALLMQERLGDIAIMKTVWFTSEPIRVVDRVGFTAGDPLSISAGTFVPRGLGERKAPLMVFVPDRAISALDTSAFKVTRALLEQGYVVIVPNYRGSGALSGMLDDGGADIDDTHAARNWAVANLPVDGARVGIMGWGYGGMHALMNVFRWPKDYQGAYAGAPVSDLVQRMAYRNDAQTAALVASIGKSVRSGAADYLARSPVFHAGKLETPLLIQASSNDEFVSIMEVEHLIAALQAENKRFEYKIYQDAPGGHAFATLDTAVGRQARAAIYEFFATRLRPRRL